MLISVLLWQEQNYHANTNHDSSFCDTAQLSARTTLLHSIVQIGRIAIPAMPPVGVTGVEPPKGVTFKAARTGVRGVKLVTAPTRTILVWLILRVPIAVCIRPYVTGVRTTMPVI